jgi:hypothetical protein
MLADYVYETTLAEILSIVKIICSSIPQRPLYRIYQYPYMNPYLDAKTKQPEHDL